MYDWIFRHSDTVLLIITILSFLLCCLIIYLYLQEARKTKMFDWIIQNFGSYEVFNTLLLSAVALIALIFLIITAFISDIINFNRLIKQSEERERKESEDNNNE